MAQAFSCLVLPEEHVLCWYQSLPAEHLAPQASSATFLSLLFFFPLPERSVVCGVKGTCVLCYVCCKLRREKHSSCFDPATEFCARSQGSGS